MSKTLRELIKANDFTGYQTSGADWRFEPDRIEEAIYGNNGSYNLPYDLVERFAKTFNVEIIAINTWTCTDTPVGLEVLRMQGTPIGLVWQSARKAEQTISFLGTDALQTFQKAWESIKENPEENANLIPDEMLDMPVPDPDEKGIEIESGKNYLPALTARGAAVWIDRQGGLESITNKAVLGYIVGALTDNIEHRDNFLDQLREREKELTPEMAASVKKSWEELEEHRANLVGMREMIKDHIQTLP